MRKHTANKRQINSILSRCVTAVLVIALMLETMAFGIAAAGSELGLSIGGHGSSVKPNGILNFDSSEVTEQLKDDILKSLRQDLVMRVKDYELSGPVGLIITFSEDSLLDKYMSSKYVNKMTYVEYRETSEAKKYEDELDEARNGMIDKLYNAGVVFEVKHNYVHMLNGVYAYSTYEDIEAICNIDGVERVTISNTYEPQAAVENPVDVYPSGIFNSGSVEYTGKGTIVAVLDTGCDYAHSAFTSYEVKNPLYDRDDIAALLDKTQASVLTPGLEAREVYYGNLTGNKIAFGYDYADKDPDIMPFSNSHGTHVAGIIAGKDDVITGVAVDAQLAIMKVFSDYEEGAKDGDIIAALEDCIVLGVDAINMSLGTSCGFTIERDADKVYKNELYGKIEAAGISLIVAASNDHSSGYGSEQGNTNKTDNPDSATVGSPATYESSLAVASISGKKENYMLANGDHVVFFIKSYSTSADEYDFFAMMGIKEGEKKTFEYVTVPGFGLAVNYAGIDVKGKIALVSRGDITFEEKVQFAEEAGAIAVIVYNNVYGDITMTIGNDAKIPAVSIGRDDGEMLVQAGSGTLEFDLSNAAGPFMSDFSSWGPTPDLHLKPEITAHGGNINSAVVGGEYDELSGTSMAAPNMCGIAVLIRQYVKEKYPEYTATQVRDLVNQLSMSTATIALDKYSHPYSPRKQGAGIADIRKATTTPAYLWVDGIGKTKLELGDDPKRTGVYEMSINLTNMSANSVSYKLGSIVMTESISSAEPEYVAEIAYLLDGATEYTVEGGVLKDGVVTVEGNKTAVVKAKITLSGKDKSYINSTFENGMFVEGFLTFDNTDENGVDMNAPFLAFYGDWGEAPIFDLDFYEVETEAHNDAIDDDDKIKADYYATTPLGSYYYDYILPLGAYLYSTEDSEYTPIPATRERAAISYFQNCISGIYGVSTGLLRGARELSVTIKNVTTGEVVFEEIQYNCYKAHYSGAPRGYMSKFDLSSLTIVDGKDGEKQISDVLGFNNNKFEVTMSAKLDWDGGINDSDTYSFSFYMDYEAPSVVDATFRTEYDKSRKENRYYVDAIIYDNHYAMSCRPIVVYEIKRENDEIDKTFSTLCNEPIPVYQENRGETSKVSIEITDYLDLISDSSMPNGLTLYLDDYAMNSAVCYIPFPETDSEDLEFMEDELTLDINETFDLTKYFVHENTTDPVETDYLKTLKWSSSDESVVAISDGQIEARKTGTAIIKVTSDSWVTQISSGENAVSEPIYKSLVVHVTENEIKDNPDSAMNVQIESLRFASYETLFAFNSDIKYSAIGETGSVRYFGGEYSLEFFPSEKIKLTPELKPWNMDESRYEFEWKSSNDRVATVDQDGVVTGIAEGKARITLSIKVDGKTSLLAARLSVEIKSEFIIENRELVAYKGWGGDVVIPDDEGILFIGSYAFSHFELDNKKEVEKDENGYYDLDEKKTPLGNNTVTSVVIPEDVETIEKHAFWGCTALTDVTLSSSVKTIEESAFEGCTALKNVNFDNVKIIADKAFYNCSALTCEDLPGGANLSGVYAVGTNTFYNCGFTSLSLDGLSRIGDACFEGCASLEEVTLGKRTRVGKEMFKNTAIKSIIVYSDTVGDNAFYGCNQLESIVFENDLTYLGAFSLGNCASLNEVIFRGGVEQIGRHAFSGCEGLEVLTLPNSAFTVGEGAFSSSGIKELVFLQNTVITDLGSSAFGGIKSLNVSADSSDVYEVKDGALYTKDGKTLVLVIPREGLSEFVVPAGVTAIGNGAFSALSELKRVTFEDGSALESIGNYAFAGCTALEGVVLPVGNITIGDYAFSNTTSLIGFDFTNVKSIGAYSFYNSSINKVIITKEGFKIGDYAFYKSWSLKTVSLGKNVLIGAYAFAKSAVKEVDLDGGATVLEGAFRECAALTSFDFEGLTGKIGDYAFYKCEKLTAVNVPEVTELGNYAFSYCFGLVSFTAPKLEVVGDYAFTPFNEEENEPFETSNRITSLELPALKKIGNRSFFGMRYLTSMDLSNVEELGIGVFGYCGLTSVTLPEGITEIPDYTFYFCYMLTELDLSSIVKIGEFALAGVSFSDGSLELPALESVGKYAFTELEGRHFITSVKAPELKYIDNYAFAGCTSLKTFSAPKVEYIGEGAFAQTAIVEIEVSDKLTKVLTNAFYNSEDFESFYTTDEDGNKSYTADLGEYMIDDGVLYEKRENGNYTLLLYPVAKKDLEYVVVDGTEYISMAAGIGNKNIEKLVFPSTLLTVGTLAFADCDNLNTLVFKSYYAPTLEGSMSRENKVTIENIDEIPGFDKLYTYDYFWRSNNEVAYPLYYMNFKDIVGTEKAQGISIIIPDNSWGYDSVLYNAYFNVDKTQTSGITAGKYAVAFMNAIGKLPEVVDRFDRLLVEDAIGAYNALLGHSEELSFVDNALVERYHAACSEYNVSVAEGKLAHLFDMDMTEYCFNLVKDARDTVLALNEEELALLANADVLDAKIAELNAVYGKEVDFTLSYQDNLPKSDPTPDPDPEPKPDGNMLVIILAVVGGAVLLGAAVAVVIVMSKKKKTPDSNIDEDTDESSEDESDSSNEN